jgi:Tol biopolymer transport system component
MDADGTDARQLTRGSLDVHPDVSADGRSVVYASFVDWSPAVGGAPTLWKIPIDGGKPVEISRQPTSYPRVSPDGARLACVYYPGKDPRFSADHMALLGMEGTGGFKIFESSPSDDTPLSWSPDGKSLDYILTANGVGNIWRQPVDGGAAYTGHQVRERRVVCVRLVARPPPRMCARDHHAGHGTD